jgi:23S rRNA maturation-related 3'-5' exoribonuclease YhaM
MEYEIELDFTDQKERIPRISLDRRKISKIINKLGELKANTLNLGPRIFSEHYGEEINAARDK